MARGWVRGRSLGTVERCMVGFWWVGLGLVSGARPQDSMTPGSMRLVIPSGIRVMSSGCLV